MLKPYFSNMARASAGFQIIDENRRRSIPAGCDNGNGINDRRVRVLGKPGDDAHFLLGKGVGLIDDPQRRFAARDEVERRAHIVSARDLALHAAPHTEFFQCGFAVFSGRHAVGIGHRQFAVTQQLRQRKAGLDLDLHFAVGGRYQHQAVAQQVRAGPRLDQLALLDVIHPVEIGGNENIRGRAVLDLLRQRRAGGIRHHHLLAIGALKLLPGVIQRLLEARRREHRQVLRLRRHDRQQQPEQHCRKPPCT